MAGAGVERAHAERAVELAVTKYCSVRDSLDPAIPVTWAVVLPEP
jgi:putative redox protein